jgi:hypothetical protein
MELQIWLEYVEARVAEERNPRAAKRLVDRNRLYLTSQCYDGASPELAALTILR